MARSLTIGVSHLVSQELRARALFQRWAESLEFRGRREDPGELCRDEPELLPTLLSLIRAFDEVDSALGSPLHRPQLGHYELIESIGKGAMGEVFRALDPTLGREIALKILPPDLAADTGRLRRFQREAKTLANLHHPNIVTLHSVEEDDGLHFLTMELVEGNTLGEMIPSEGLDLASFFDLAVPLADAIGAAHSQGLVHRDIKPGNLMVDRRGQLKVLDFGLAKRIPVDEPSSANHEHSSDQRLGDTELTSCQSITETATDVGAPTRQGAIVGTPSYMAPEQALGGSVDARSDVFAIGAVLYEMLTGRRAFRADSDRATGTALPERLPAAVRDVRGEVPSQLERIVLRCLELEPCARYESAAELYTELERCGSRLGTGNRVPRIVGLVAVLPVVVGLAYLSLRPRPDRGGPRLTNPVQLTSAVGIESSPTWSPDKRQIAYEGDQNGNWDIWVIPRDGGEPRNLTKENTGPDRYPAWSPDGQHIAFLSLRREDWGLYMASSGGAARKVASLPIDLAYYRGAPQWSSDGAEIAVLVWDAPSSEVQIFSLKSLQTRRLRVQARQGTPNLDLSWSPDGRTFAYVAADGAGSEVARLWTIPAQGGDPTPLTDGHRNDHDPFWSADSKKLLFLSNRGGAMDLWQQSMARGGLPEGEAQPLTTGMVIRSAALSPDGAKLAYSRGRPISHLWRIPILGDRLAVWSDAEQLTFDNALVEYVDISPDGELLAVSSDRAGNQDLWLLPSAGGPMRQLTTDPAHDWSPRWSPDGTEIVFYSFRSGNRDIWVVPTGGGPERSLASHPAEETSPAWSPDGTEITFVSRRSGNLDVWIVSSHGGEPRQLTTELADEDVAYWSKEGILFYSTPFFYWKPADGGEAERLFRARDSFARPSADNSEIYYMSSEEQAGNFWAYSLSDGRARPLTDLSGRRGALGWGLATDGRYLYFTWSQETGDLWIMDVL